MANTISAALSALLTTTETVDDGSLSSSNNAVVHNAFNASGVTLNSASTPPVTKVVAFRQALTGGAATIDLTSLTGLNGASDSGAGLKLQAILARPVSGNSGNTITLTVGASAGYKLAGVASWLIPMTKGGGCLWWNGVDVGDDVTNSSLDTIDLAGTGTDAVDLTLLFG